MPGSRRPHQKTRTGCISCKQRRIKCDELKPSCRYCTKRSYECIYRSANPRSLPPCSEALRQESLPLPESSSTAASTPVHTPIAIRGEWSTKDLELFHFYTVSTCLTFSLIPERQHVWQHVVPKIAFPHSFLLYGLLAISASHLARLTPDRKDALTADASMYHTTALPMFRSALSSIDSQNCHACAAFSMLVVVYKWASVKDAGDLFFADTADQAEADTVEWVQLLRGAGSLINCYYQEIIQGPLGPISQWDNAAERSAEANPEHCDRFTALEQLWDAAPVPFDTIEVDALKEALRWLKILYTMISRPNDKIDAASDALSWPVQIPELFLLMANRKQPEALVLLAHYCLLLNKVEDFWWIRGMSRHLLQEIHRALGTEWENWISWPLQDLVLCEFKNHYSRSVQ
ncbi:hypothetical protein F5884DRAFT_443481 [Xylogone sp. PMI_703]|nr:hypothetical protein F5884DRAFT_443481 [Xylogone sp. PMI_703]